MSAFTPGPWFAEQQFQARRRDDHSAPLSLGWIINFSGGRIGWSSYVTAEPNEGEGAPHPISGANARLIAAAPDLLEALERSLNWLSSYPGEGALNAYEQARAAIAKATVTP